MPWLCPSRKAGGMIVSVRACRSLRHASIRTSLRPARSRHDPPGGVDADVGIVRGVDNQVRARIAFRQRVQRLPPLFLGEGNHDQVADRDARSSARQRSRCLAPPTCSAHRTPSRRLSRLQWHVEHGADAVRDRDTRRGTHSYVDRCARHRRRRRVRGRWRRNSQGSRGDTAPSRTRSGRRAAKQADAVNQCVLVVELPHAQPLDLQRASGDVQDALQPIVEVLAGVGVAGRELG